MPTVSLQLAFPQMYTIASGFLLSAARRAASAGRDHVDDAVVAELFAALAVESWINDLLFIVRNYRDSDLPQVFATLKPMASACRLEDRQTSLVTRLDVIVLCLSTKPLDWGRQPYQDFSLLLDIRNHLAHQRPETLDVEELELESGTITTRQANLSKLAAQLVARRIVARPPDPVMAATLYFLQQPPCGVWAYNTACATISDVVSLIPHEWLRQQLTFSLSDLLTPLPAVGG